MAIDFKQLEKLLTRNAKNYWFSSKVDDDTYENVSIDNVKQGDIIWFSKDAELQDIADANKALSSLKLHMYSVTLDRNKEEYTGEPMKSKSGAFSMLVLPDNQ